MTRQGGIATIVSRYGRKTSFEFPDPDQRARRVRPDAQASQRHFQPLRRIAASKVTHSIGTKKDANKVAMCEPSRYDHLHVG